MRPRGVEISEWRAWRSGRGGLCYRWRLGDEQYRCSPCLLLSHFYSSESNKGVNTVL